MRRSIMLTIAASALAGGCAHHPQQPAAPHGLLYDCGGKQLSIEYGDQGYVPGSSVREPYAAPDFRQRPRATATLRFRGREYRMVADESFQDLRYIESEAAAGERLGWVARAETAELLTVAPAGAESPLARCTRIRSVETRLDGEPSGQPYPAQHR